MVAIWFPNIFSSGKTSGPLHLHSPAVLGKTQDAIASKLALAPKTPVLSGALHRALNHALHRIHFKTSFLPPNEFGGMNAAQFIARWTTFEMTSSSLLQAVGRILTPCFPLSFSRPCSKSTNVPSASGGGVSSEGEAREFTLSPPKADRRGGVLEPALSVVEGGVPHFSSPPSRKACAELAEAEGGVRGMVQ
jgi:hypothetical protein